MAGCLRASTGGGDKPHVLAPIAFSSKDYGGDAEFDLSPTLRAGGHHGSHANAGVPPAIAFDSRQDPVSSTEVFGALGSSSPQAQAVCIHADAIGRTGEAITPSADAEGRVRLRNPGMGIINDGTTYNLTATGQPHAVCVTGDVTHTLKAEGFDASEDGTGRGQPIVPSLAFAQNTRDEVRLLGGDGEVVGALAAQPGMKQTTYVAPGGMAVRRLTPIECERLQSFPDGYTSIPTWNGWRAMGEDETPEGCIEQGLEVRQNKKTGKWRVKDVDGPRYKALGNSMCVYNMRWIGRRIDAQLKAMEAA